MNRTRSFEAFAAVSALFVAAGLPLSGCGKKTEPAEVVIALPEAAAPLSNATVLVDYSQASATLVKTGGEPACATIVPNMTAHFSDDGQGRMTIQANAPQGISAPVDLAVCRMVPDAPGVDGKAIASRLRVSLVAGADRAGAPLDEKRLARTGGKRDGGGADAASERPATAERTGDAPGGVAGERAARGHGGSAAGGAAAPEGGGDERLAAVPDQGMRAGAAPPAPAAEPKSLVPRSNADRAGAPADGSGNDRPGGGDDAGDDEQDPGTADANDDSDTDRTARSFAVTVGVTNAAGRLGALQFDITYRGSGGGFAGAAGSARCQTEIPAALATFNDKGNGTLSGALVDLDGIETPGAVATCTFKSRGNVSAGDFSIRVVDAADVEGNAPTTAAQMSVQNLRAQ